MIRILALGLVLLALGCAKKEATPAPGASPQAEAPAAPAFAGKVWRVTQSTAVSPGTTYDFRGDGTLVVSSPGDP